MSEGRKIYNKLVIDMKSGEVVEEDSFIYFGDVALCDGEQSPYGEFFGEVDGGHKEGGEEGELAEGEEAAGDDAGGEVDELEEEGDLDAADPSALLKQIRSLQARIEELSELGPQNQQQQQQQQQEEYQEVDFIGSEDNLDDILGDPKKLNQTLNTAVQKSIEMVHKSIPKIVQNAVAQQQQMTKMAEEFYGENPELKDYKQFVGRVSEKIMSENPDWGMEKVMEETAKESRRRLQLRGKAQKTGKTSGPTRKSGSTRRAPGKPDPKQSEIDAMNKALAR